MRVMTINGRIAQDVTRQVAKSGNEFISFSIANSEFGDPKSSDGKPQTQWFRVTSFMPQHINLSQHLKKGKPITVIGKYSNRLYQSQQTGQWNISNDIVATDIYFEIGSDRVHGEGSHTESGTTMSPQASAAQVSGAVNEIPQATSRKMTAPKAEVGQSPSASTNVGDDDDLPF